MKDFEQKCLDRLNQERRTTILRPLRDSGTYLGLLGGAGGLASLLVPGNAPWVVSMAAMSGVYFTKDIINSLSNWYDTKPHPVDRFEKIYAQNKCQHYLPPVFRGTMCLKT